MRVFLIVLSSLFAGSVLAQLHGKVVSVADGDTFTLLTDSKKQIRVRLYGIDCPEKTQDFGMVAKEFLSNLIFNKYVSVKEKNTDRYGRMVGIAQVGKVNVNEALLQAGMAWHYNAYDHNSQWQMMERKARESKKGLWIKKNPIEPWIFRKTKRKQT